MRSNLDWKEEKTSEDGNGKNFGSFVPPTPLNTSHAVFEPSSAWFRPRVEVKLTTQFAEHTKLKSDLTWTLLHAGTFSAMTSFKVRPSNLNVAEDLREPRARDI